MGLGLIELNKVLLHSCVEDKMVWCIQSVRGSIFIFLVGLLLSCGACECKKNYILMFPWVHYIANEQHLTYRHVKVVSFKEHTFILGEFL